METTWSYNFSLDAMESSKGEVRRISTSKDGSKICPLDKCHKQFKEGEIIQHLQTFHQKEIGYFSDLLS